MASTAQLLIQIRADASQAMTAIHGLETNLKSFSSLGTAALPASLALAGAGAAITAGLGVAVKTAADFDAQMVNIRNNTNMSAQDQDTLRKAVVVMGQDSGAAYDQLAEGGKKAMNITGNMASSLAILDVAQKSAVSTGANVAQVTNVLANAMHEYNADVGTSAQVHQNAALYMGVMHQAAAMSNMDLQEFAANSGRAIGIAANLGVPIEQVAAAYVALTKHGYDAATAQVQIVNAMTHMINPTAQARAELEKLSQASGIDLVDDFSAQALATKGLDGVMQDITHAYMRVGLTQAQATGETMKLIAAQRGGLGLATALGTGAEDYAHALDVLGNKQAMAVLTDDSMARTHETLNNQMAVLSNRTQAFGMALGSVLLPPLTIIVGTLAALASGLASLPPFALTLIGVTATLAATVLSTAGALGLLMLMAPRLIIGFQALGALYGLLTGSILKVAAAWTMEAASAVAAATATVAAWLAAAGPITLIIGGIALAAGAIALALSGHLGDAKDAIANGIARIGDAVKTGWDFISKVATPTAEAAGLDVGDTFGQSTAKAIEKAAPAIADTAAKTAKAAKTAADEALKGIQDAAASRKATFDLGHVEDERNVLSTKLDQTVAESALLDYKRQMEDLDRSAVDYARKRLELDEQDAITKAKIAESALKARDEDLSYTEKLIKAELLASRHGGAPMDRASARAQLKDLHTQQILNAPGLLMAEHNTALATRAKEQTDLRGTLATSGIDRQKLALQEAMAPYEAQATLAKRATENAQRALDLEKQRFAITESYYEKDKLRAEIAAKDAERNLFSVEHASQNRPQVNVGGINVSVPAGGLSDVEKQQLHDETISVVSASLNDALSGRSTPVSPQMGGGVYSAA